MANISETPPNVDPLKTPPHLHLKPWTDSFFVFLSMYHITETVVIIENGMLRETHSLWKIMKTNLWVIQFYSALRRVKD